MFIAIGPKGGIAGSTGEGPDLKIFSGPAEIIELSGTTMQPIGRHHVTNPSTVALSEKGRATVVREADGGFVIVATPA